MSTGSAARDRVKAALEAEGITYSDHGAPFTAPGVVAVAGDPWIASGDTFGTLATTLTLYAITGRVMTREAIEQLENLIDDVTGALLRVGVVSWSKPSQVSFGSDVLYLGASTNLTIE